jgi:SAM-dependent methyltransferase
MSDRVLDTVFAGSVPEIYEKYLVPLIFESYAADLAQRLATRSLTRVLEVAAGTGVVTRALASHLPERVAIIATDLSQPMLDRAKLIGTQRAVAWQQADALQLPFADASFDAIACQFGVMFFPDKARAFAEARRVLKPSGVFIFNVWDRIEINDFANSVTNALATVFPMDPPRFLARTPHGYHDADIIKRDLARAGFTATPEIATIAARSRADSCRTPAVAYCMGTPLRNEIETRDPSSLAKATDAAATEIGRRFGHSAVDGAIQAHVVTVTAQDALAS